MAVIQYSDNSFNFYRRQLEEQEVARIARIPGGHVRILAKQLVEQAVPVVTLGVEDGKREDSQELDWRGGPSESSWATDDEVF